MTGDMQRDHEATEHRFATADVPWTDDDYAAAQQAETEQRCGRPLAHWESPHVSTPCGRPLLHDGDCHPVPLAGDKEDT